MKKDGFTFIELILYVAIITIFVGGAIQFAWNTIYTRVKGSVVREVTQNLQYTSKRIVGEIRSASGINSVSATSLCLSSATAARNPTRIYLSGGRVRIGWGGGSVNCTGLTNDYAITSNKVTASTLQFTNLSSGTGASKNIQYRLIMSYNNSGNRKEFNRTDTASGSAEVRSN